MLLNLECEYGYYKLDSNCVACPVNTYKDAIGNAQNCTQCPAESTTRGAMTQTSDTCCKFLCSQIKDMV